MPIYRYKCKKCSKEREQFNTYADNTRKAPDCCGDRMRIVITPPMVRVDNMPTYKCPATGEIVTTRRQRNEIFARHGLMEALPLPKPKPRPKMLTEEDVGMTWAEAASEIHPV